MEQKYDFLEAEKEMQQLWRENEIYKFKNTDLSKVFSIDTPPPTVSGKLHIGHVFSYTQAEMIARFHRMQGENVYYPFGFDDNGLPTERLVEREQGIRAKDMKRSEFGKKCLEITNHYEEEFKEMWESLGFSVDWSLKYKTIDPKSMRISQRSFLELAKRGRAYRKESPVLWCTCCQTSIAQAELESKELSSVFNDLTFMIGDQKLTIATTRPELLYGCVCIFVHPEDERYQSLIGKSATVPLYNFEIPILSDELVDPKKGTGAVMCATYGDQTDVEWCQKYNLPYKKVINSDGRIDESVPLIGGLKVSAARETILKCLSDAGLLTKQEAISHAVAVHERCGKEIEILPSMQWYIDVLTDRERYLQAADEIRWYPESMKNRYKNWVMNLKWDWCISRQRFFGVPFPVWYCKNCHEPMFATDDQLPCNPLETKPLKPCSCGCNEFIPETAVFDTWATSSVTPLIHANYKEENERPDFLPMSMRAQAHDIIRTWAFYSIVKSLYHTGKLPWKNLMISGFVLAKKGEKISKSKSNNTMSPAALIQKHSADAMRYWAAAVNLGTDTFFDEADLKISKKFLTKLWNAAKFSIYHLEDFEEELIENYKQRWNEYRKGNQSIEESGFLPYDIYLMEKAEDTMKQAKEYLEKFEIGQSRKIIDDFFWKDYCDYYIEVVKERLYQPDKHGNESRCSAQYAIYHTLLNILEMYAIYVPHMTDYIYQQYYRKFEKNISIHTMCWGGPKAMEKKIETFGQQLNQEVAKVRKWKSEQNLSMKDEIESVIIECESELIPYFEASRMDLCACMKTENLTIRES